MANILTPNQRSRFGLPTADLRKIQRTGYVINTFLPVQIPLTDRVISWGQTTIRAFGYNPIQKQPEQNIYPQMEWRLRNDDGFLSPGYPGSIWGNGALDDPELFNMNFTVIDTGVTPNVTMVNYTLRVLSAEVDGNIAIVRGAHYLQRILQAEFNENAFDWVDWATNGVPHSVSP